MKLPIPEMASFHKEHGDNIKKFQEALSKIDRKKFGKEVLMNLKNPLVDSDFKNLSQKWIVVKNPNDDETYLMFINNSPSELAKKDEERVSLRLYYVELLYQEKKLGTHFQNLRFDGAGGYYDTVNGLLTWSRCYLVDSGNSHPFMNWTETPFEVKS